MWRFLFVTCALLKVLAGDEVGLQTVDDAELDKLVKEEHFVIALFCDDSNAEQCDDMESELTGIREDFIDTMGDGWVVKLSNSKVVSRYTSASSKPVVVYFRQSIPLLYNGPVNGELMMESFVLCKEASVKELTDTTFEHLTQAATGATTGDWFVLFYTDECEKCSTLVAVMETLACQHKGRINIAKVNKQTHGEKTGRRFELGLESKPQFIFFRLGRMYRYNLEKYDVDSMSSFITGFFKNYPAESIPLPKTPFDDLVQLCVDYLKEYPMMVGLAVALPVILLLAFIWLMKSDAPKEKKSKKKKNKENKDK